MCLFIHTFSFFQSCNFFVTCYFDFHGCNNIGVNAAYWVQNFLHLMYCSVKFCIKSKKVKGVFRLFEFLNFLYSGLRKKKRFLKIKKSLNCLKRWSDICIQVFPLMPVSKTKKKLPEKFTFPKRFDPQCLRFYFPKNYFFKK